MILPVFKQGNLFLGTICAGVVMAFIYDIIRVSRRIIPHKALYINLEDILYWIIVALGMFYFLLMENSGEVRLFSVFGVFIGMFLYSMLISRHFMNVSMRVYYFVRKVFLLLLNIVLAPFRLIIRLLSYPARFIFRHMNRFYTYEKRLAGNIQMKGRQKARRLKSNIKIILRKY